MAFYKKFQQRDLSILSGHWQEFATELQPGNKSYSGRYGVGDIQIETSSGRLLRTQPKAGEPRLEGTQLVGALLLVQKLQTERYQDTRHNLIFYSKMGALAVRQIHDESEKNHVPIKPVTLNALQVTLGAIQSRLFSTFEPMPKKQRWERDAFVDLIKAGIVLGTIDPNE